MHYKFPVPCIYSLDIDLQGDFTSKVYANLHRAGYKDADRNQALYQYFNPRKRRIEQKPRRIYRSAELICPAEYEKALTEFTEKVERGECLMPFQPQKIKDITYNDLFLNDWGVQSFHLTRRFRDE